MQPHFSPIGVYFDVVFWVNFSGQNVNKRDMQIMQIMQI